MAIQSLQAIVGKRNVWVPTPEARTSTRGPSALQGRVLFNLPDVGDGIEDDVMTQVECVLR